MTLMAGPIPDAASRPTMIYFYGNAMCLSTTRSATSIGSAAWV